MNREQQGWSDLYRARAIGVVISIAALVFIFLFAEQTSFSIRLESWFSQESWLQFMPLASSILLLVAGVLTIGAKPTANFMLVLFGHTTSEEIIFGWLGLTSTSANFLDWIGFKTISFPDFAVLWFFGFAVIALLIAYSNILNLRRVTLGEALFGIVTGVFISLMPNYM